MSNSGKLKQVCILMKKLVVTKRLNKGDIILLIDGGHGFKIMEDAVIMEIKQGPYVGIEDKEHFT